MNVQNFLHKLKVAFQLIDVILILIIAGQGPTVRVEVGWTFFFPIHVSCFFLFQGNDSIQTEILSQEAVKPKAPSQQINIETGNHRVLMTIHRSIVL